MKTILVVEDDQSLALAYKKKFTQAGYEAQMAYDGESGFSKAIQGKPDIIILDIMLPGKMNGFDVLQQLKLSAETKNIPVIMMTNLAEQGKAAIEAGAAEYLLKVNISLTKLLEKIEKYLSK